MRGLWFKRWGWLLLVAGACIVAWLWLGERIVLDVRGLGFSQRGPAAAQDLAARDLVELWVHVVGERAGCVDAGACSSAERNAGAQSYEPLTGVQLRLLRPGAEPSPLRAEAESAADGQALLRVPAGSYWLLASAHGHARFSAQLRLDRPHQELQVELEPERALRVRVLDDAERPLAGATVLLSRGDPFVERGETSATGVVTFQGVGERVDGLHVEAPGFAPLTLQPASRDVTLRLSAPASLSVNVLEVDGTPASGASVWLSGLDFWPPRQLSAAADGALEWQGLARGNYELRATHAGHVGTSSVNLERGEHGRVTLQLAAGRDLAIRLVAADAAGRAVPGGEIVLVEDGLGPFPLRGQTGSDGRLTLGPVPFRPFTLSARAPGFMPESAVPVAADARELQVALLRAGRVLGRVLDPQGAPVAGASLEVVGNDVHGRPIARRALGDALDLGGAFAPPPLLIPLGELGVMPLPGATGSGAERASWVSDRNGNFRLDEVPPGSIRVLARHPRFVESTSSELSLAPGGEVSVELVLPRGAALLGRLLDVGGRPVVGAHIEVRARHGTEQSSTFSREDGSFRFDNVASESDVLVARPSDRERFVLRKALELGSGETRRMELTLPAERAPLELEVTGPDRRPIAAAQASLLSLDPDSPARQSVLTDASGRARFRDAAGRALALRIAAPGYATFEAQLDGAPQRFEVNLERAVLVTGRVTQVRGRQPLAGARVVLTQRGERRSTSSDAQGQFQFAEAAPGAAELNVSHRGFATRTARLTIVATGRADRAFELPPIDLLEGGAVEGRVIDATGAPVRGARIGLGLVPAFVPAGAEPAELTRSDAAGRFRLEGIALGKTTVSAYAAGLGRGSVADVEVRAGDSAAPVEIRLSGGSAPSDGDSPASLAVTLGERSGSAGNEVVIVDVAAGSEAERAGLRVGDVLVAVDGADVNDMTDARRRLGGNVASDVIIDLERGDELFSLNVRREAVQR